jgi:hypothetical protein
MNSQEELKFQIPKGKKQTQVEVSIRFGNPKYEDCRNFGICKMSASHLPKFISRQKRQCANATLILYGDFLKIYFDKSSMNEQTKSIYFLEKKYFVMEVEKLIPKAISQALSKVELLIPKNDYLIEEELDYYMISVCAVNIDILPHLENR